MKLPTPRLLSILVLQALLAGGGAAIPCLEPLRPSLQALVAEPEGDATLVWWEEESAGLPGIGADVLRMALGRAANPEEWSRLSLAPPRPVRFDLHSAGGLVIAALASPSVHGDQVRARIGSVADSALPYPVVYTAAPGKKVSEVRVQACGGGRAVVLVTLKGGLETLYRRDAVLLTLHAGDHGAPTATKLEHLEGKDDFGHRLLCTATEALVVWSTGTGGHQDHIKYAVISPSGDTLAAGRVQDGPYPPWRSDVLGWTDGNYLLAWEPQIEDRLFLMEFAIQGGSGRRIALGQGAGGSISDWALQALDSTSAVLVAGAKGGAQVPGGTSQSWTGLLAYEVVQGEQGGALEPVLLVTDYLPAGLSVLPGQEGSVAVFWHAVGKKGDNPSNGIFAATYTRGSGWSMPVALEGPGGMPCNLHGLVAGSLGGGEYLTASLGDCGAGQGGYRSEHTLGVWVAKWTEAGWGGAEQAICREQ